MDEPTFTCPRCLYDVPMRPQGRFCPHCGLAGARDAAMDTSPLRVTVGGCVYAVHERIAVGSISSVYRCRFERDRATVEGVFKIARDARTNGFIANEAAVLRRLRAADADGRFAPFLPGVEQSFAFDGDPSGPPRQANVLRTHPAIRSPDELYTLSEVRGFYPHGLDARDMAWVWRRVLTVLGFAHAQGVVHAAVLPPHVLIEPREHKLVLIDWCAATVGDDPRDRRPLALLSGGHAPWYEAEVAVGRPPTPALDVALAARCMMELMGGDPVRAVLPPAIDPALQRYFHRCIDGTAPRAAAAAALLGDFDRLIEVLWGPRTFRPLTMPPKRKT